MADYSQVHHDLTGLKQFCVRCEKQPYVHDGTKNTFKPSWTNPQDWLTFAEALDALQRQAKVFYQGEMRAVTGIGWLCRRGEPQILGGDLDCCRDPETGLISPWATAFLQQVKPFYAEVSPSKCGIRFFSWGRLPGERAKVFDNGPQDDMPEETRKRILETKPKAKEKLAMGEPAFNGLELYESGRHLTLTGEKLDEYCFAKEDVTEAVSQALAPFIEAEPVKKAPKKQSGNKLPLLDIQNVINCNGFTEEGGQLFGPHPTLGSTTGKNLVVNPGKNVYCYMHDGIDAGGDPWVWLACECGAVPWEQAGSGALDNSQVIKKTLIHAVKRNLVSAEDVGIKQHELNDDQPDCLTMEDCFKTQIKEKKNGEIVIDPETGEAVEVSVFSPDRTKKSIEKKFHVAMVRGDEKTIWRFDGGIYRDNGKPFFKNAIYNVAEDKIEPKDINEVIDRLTSSLLLKPVTFNPDPYLLAVMNGVVDLRTGERRDYRPEDLITDQIDVAYDPTAKCPKFIQFLEDVAPNPTDRLMLIDWYAVHAIREMYPYILFLNGLGRNGKGVYENVLKRFYGENAFSGMPLEELSAKNNRFAGADLAGKRGQIVAEAGESHAKGKRTIPTAFLKNATGDGVIDSDQKNKGRIKFKPFYKSTIDSNDMPRIEDSSKGWIERFCKADLPFSYVDDPKNQMERKKDPRLFDKLTTPEELSGILNLILSRTPDIIKTGAITKRSGSEMFAEYQKQSNSVTTFLENFCEYIPPKILRSNDDALNYRPIDDVALEVVYKAYCNWCDRIVADKVNDQRFGAIVKTFCNDIKSERIRCGDTRIRVYHGFTFDVKAYQSQVSQSVPTLSQQNKKQSQVSQDIGQNAWTYIKEKFGEKPSLNPSENGIPPHFSELGTDSDSQNTVGTDNGHLGTDLTPLGPDVDSTANRKKESPPAPGCLGESSDHQAGMGPHPLRDEPTPPKKCICAKCGADLTGKGTITKNGELYCAQVGCGYPARGGA